MRDMQVAQARLAKIGLATTVTVAVVASAVPLASLDRTQSQVPTTSVLLDDWGLEHPAQLRVGQLSLIHRTAGDSLVVYMLDDTLPIPPPAGFLSATPQLSGDILLIADFASGVRNQLGGYFDAYRRAPSDATASLAAATDGIRALRLSYNKEGDGYCGLWIHLFDTTRQPFQRVFLDARPFKVLSFWVRGGRGGESVQLKLADAEWEQKEDAFPLGNVSAFLPSGRITTAWQQAVVSVDRFPARVDKSQLASIVLEVRSGGTGQVYISSLAFSLSRDSLPMLPSPTARPTVRGTAKATWVWNTDELLEDAARQDELFGFLSAEGFDRVFLQLTDSEDTASRSGELDVDPRFRPLIAKLNHYAIAAYALDGFKAYALPTYHDAVLKTIENVVRYNEDSSPEERFHGIHYDIEPYLLSGFHGPRRQEILRAYLTLIDRSARRAAEAGLAYGVDIPFWYDTRSEYTNQPVTVEYNGERKPASHHVIDLVDEVTLMDYRTRAFGPDGTIRHAEGELAYAAATGKRVLIGLETAPLPDEELFDFAGLPESGLPKSASPERLIVATQRGDSLRLYLVTGDDRSARQRLLTEVAGQIGPNGQTATVWWAIRQRVTVPGNKLSFSTLGMGRLREVMDQTAVDLQQYESFAGFALHHAWSYRDLATAGR